MPTNFSKRATSTRKPRQQTLEAVLSRAWSSKSGAPGSSPGTAQDVDDEAQKEAQEEESNSNSDEDEDEDDLPIRRRPPRSSRVLFRTSLASRNIRSALSPAVAVASGSKRRSHAVAVDSEDDKGDSDGDDDDDDMRPTKRRRQNRTAVQSSDDDNSISGDEDEDDLVILTPQPKPTPQSNATAETRTPKTHLGRGPGEESVPSRSLRKRVPPSARSARQRHMELLRRRRMGEKVTTSDLEGSSEEEEGDGAAGGTPRIALYDKDPDHVALSDFEDEEEEKDEGLKGEEEEVEAQGEEEDDDDENDGADAPSESEKAEKRRKKEEKRRRRERKKAKKEEEKEKKKKPEEDAVQFSRIMQLSSRFDDDEQVGDGEDDGYGFNDEEKESVEDDMADFIDDSHVVGLIGAPEGGEDPGTEAMRQQAVEDEMAMLRREMPLQFTFQAHKPLKSHFKDAVEWLVHRRINRPTPDGHNQRGHRAPSSPPAPTSFASYCNDEIYRVAWDRLDREIGGLARSRFISSTWTPEFHSALQARPYMDSFNLRPGRGAAGGGGNVYFPGAEENICHACGRTNHPASFRVEFSGKAYNSSTLDDVEGEEDEDEDDEEDNESVDMHGNGLPPTTRQWYVGTVCHSNAETAHGLLHWRRALMDWVEEKLVADRVLERLEGSGSRSGGSRKHKKPLKARKRRDYANQIVDGWEENGTITSLFRDFMKLLEEAQAKSTMTTSRYGR